MKVVTTSLLLVVGVFLVACGPSQAKRDAQVTQIAANVFATQTAEAPAATPTPTLLTDAEFTEAAREVCAALKACLDAAYSHTNLRSWREAQNEALGQAAVGLSGIEMTEKSASQGFLLRSSLIELANISNLFDAALVDALDEVDYQGRVNLVTTMEGYVILLLLDESNLERLDIEKELVLKLIETRTVVHEIAISLGLDDCAM